jgi:hypothetical protein
MISARTLDAEKERKQMIQGEPATRGLRADA